MLTFNETVTDPGAMADAVGEHELAERIAWTSVYLQRLRDRLTLGGFLEPHRYANAVDLGRRPDVPHPPSTYCRCRAPEDLPPLDITLAEHTHHIRQAKDLAACAMDRFHQLNDSQLPSESEADHDGHFDRDGFAQEIAGL